MALRAPSQRLWALAFAAVVVAAGAWLWALSGRPGEDAVARPAPRPAIAVLVDAGPPTGTQTDVAGGVSVLVPPGFTSTRIDEGNITLADARGVEIVIGVRSGDALAKLSEPKQAAINYGLQNDLTLTQLVMRTPTEMVASYTAVHDGTPSRQSLIIVSRPSYRVAVLLTISGPASTDPSIARLVDELAHGRLTLP